MYVHHGHLKKNLVSSRCLCYFLVARQKHAMENMVNMEQLIYPVSWKFCIIFVQQLWQILWVYWSGKLGWAVLDFGIQFMRLLRGFFAYFWNISAVTYFGMEVKIVSPHGVVRYTYLLHIFILTVWARYAYILKITERNTRPPYIHWL